jgi:hypothetical protein
MTNMNPPKSSSFRWIAPGLSLLLVSISVAAAPSAAPAPAAAPEASASSTGAPGATVEPNAAPSASAGTANTEPAGRRTALIANLTLKVVNPKEARKALEERTKALGGFPILVSDDDLRLKVPPARLSALLDTAADQGLVIEKSLERADLTLEIAKLESQLESKRAILAELRGFFDGSDVAATLQIEQSMTELVNELESVKGQLRVLHDRASWAVVDVAFQFKERQRLTDVTSPFDWLNTVNLPRFLAEF